MGLRLRIAVGIGLVLWGAYCAAEGTNSAWRNEPLGNLYLRISKGHSVLPSLGHSYRPEAFLWVGWGVFLILFGLCVARARRMCE